ncbi:hypothetical protein PPACK8108_LOCUS14514 [Phakopsora pachyrhizi]|uniref:Uncharacterized protein n=1 Tax=Phakopsora pachyrhizi TaxID=170000 RepID=A0AAV0B8E0_PHAPC|nr:hypothetical protein PPACK8108_LOCUS14514 [Phakopsora pachyrhizi]
MSLFPDILEDVNLQLYKNLNRSGDTGIPAVAMFALKGIQNDRAETEDPKCSNCCTAEWMIGILLVVVADGTISLGFPLTSEYSTPGEDGFHTKFVD